MDANADDVSTNADAISGNAEAIAINQDAAPAGRLLKTMPTTLGVAADAAMVYGRSLSDGSAAVAFYNPNDAPTHGSVDFAQLGWSGTTSATVRDLWAHKSLGVTTGKFPAGEPLAVGAHETVLLRLTPKKEVEVA